MNYVEYPVDPLLKPFVNRIWEFDMQVPGDEVVDQPDSCTATTHFIFCLKRPFKTNRGGELLQANTANLITPLTQPVVNRLEGDHINVGIEFTITGFYRLWQIPICAITSLQADLHDLGAIIGPASEQLYQQLLEAATPTERFYLIEKFLLRQIDSKSTKAGFVEGLMELVQQDPEGLLVHKLSKGLNCSERTLSRHFKEQLGISPKTYLRFQRFLRLRTQLLEQPNWRWQTSLSSSDYYDQAHFINEFVALSGRSPSVYRKTLNEVEEFFAKKFN